MRIFGFLLCFLCSASLSSAVGIGDLNIVDVSYDAISFLNTLPGNPNYAPEGISNSGIVAGDYFLQLGKTYEAGGFTYSNGVLTRFAYPSVPTYVLTTGVNDSGTLTLSSPQSAMAFVGKPGTFTPVIFPGSTQTSLYTINDAGVAVGSYIDASSVRHGFIYRPDGTYTSFDTPYTGFGGTELTGINNLGDLVGIGGGQPFLYTNGVFVPIDIARPTSINDSQQILIPAAYHGDDILDYRTSTLEIIQPSGYLQPFQARFNDVGVITGGSSGFLLTPVAAVATPEPATGLLVLPVLAVFALAVKRVRA